MMKYFLLLFNVIMNMLICFTFTYLVIRDSFRPYVQVGEWAAAGL